MSCNGQRVARHPWIGEVLSARGPSSSSARLVSCGLFNHMEREGTGATAAERTLAIETGMSRSTVQLALRTLQEEGWVLRREKGRGKWGQTIYVYEATIPTEAVPMDRPPDQLPDISMDRPAAGNGPISPAQWTDSSNSLDRQSGLNHSETVFRTGYGREARPDPGSPKDDRKAEPKSLESAATVLKKLRKQLGMSADEVRRERKYDRELRHAGQGEELDE
jgi:DNA-binding transcriptional ArsR family regulator